MDEVFFDVREDPDLLLQFDRLAALGQAVVLSEAVTEASEPIVRVAKGLAPSPVIAEGVRLINVTVMENGAVKAEIGLPGGRHPWFHGLFVERGTGPRVQKTTGRRTGSMPARPFLRPAFDTEKINAQNRFADVLRRRLEAIAIG